MDEFHKLMRRFLITGSNLALVVVFIAMLFNCKRDTEFSHHLLIENNTSDSLHFQITRKSISDIPGWHRTLPPMQRVLQSAGALHIKGNEIIFKIINENFGLSTDTVEILRRDSIIVKWGGPLRNMPDSLNHFYNKNSWDVTCGGNDCKWQRGTFTIYEADLRKSIKK